MIFSIEEIKVDPIKGYTIQLLTGLLGYFIGWSLYRRGLGFAFDFERLRFKWEHMLVIVLIVLFILFLTLMMYSLNVFGSLVGFLVSLLIFLYYSIKKETSEN